MVEAVQGEPSRASVATLSVGQESVSEGFSKRLRAAIGEQPILRFAQKCGISDSLIRKYLEGSLPGLEKLIVLARAADVRVGWLATGEPPVCASGIASDMDPASSPRPCVPDEFHVIPRYGGQMSGADVVGGIGEKVALRRDWLLRTGLRPEQLVLVVARGDSMDPSITEGDWLLVDTREQDVTEDAIYVIRLDQHVVAKRLQLDWGAGLWVRSDNPQYADQHIPELPAARFRIVGRVVWIARRT